MEEWPKVEAWAGVPFFKEVKIDTGSVYYSFINKEKDMITAFRYSNVEKMWKKISCLNIEDYKNWRDAVKEEWVFIPYQDDFEGNV